MTIRIRVSVEYETEETLEYEQQAWQNGDVGLSELYALAQPSGDIAADDTIKIRFERV